MGLIPEQSFTVRVPAWWDNKKEYVLDEYPGREQAMLEAGHNWDVIEVPLRGAFPNEVLAAAGRETSENGEGKLLKIDGYVAHVRSDNLFTLRAGVESFERIANSVAYDIAEILLDDGFLYETGGILDGGKQCYLTLLLNEPVVITGDTSTTLPYVGESWCHDGSGSLKVRSTSIRQVCENTVSASEAEGKKLGTDFTFRHTKNVHERIAEAKKAIKGIRQDHDIYVEAMEALAAMPVTPEQRDLYVATIIGDANGVLSKSATTSPRVKTNIEAERAKINALFFGPTIPEAHLLTGYGLHLAGVEYFDHVRAFRSKDSYVRRTLLTDNPAKANLTRTIREIVGAAAA
jgi:phage/plasmid-like protein (TIGR03299 family)